MTSVSNTTRTRKKPAPSYDDTISCICQYCNAIWDSFNDLLSHLKTQHGDVVGYWYNDNDADEDEKWAEEMLKTLREDDGFEKKNKTAQGLLVMVSNSKGQDLARWIVLPNTNAKQSSTSASSRKQSKKKKKKKHKKKKGKKRPELACNGQSESSKGNNINSSTNNNNDYETNQMLDNIVKQHDVVKSILKATRKRSLEGDKLVEPASKKSHVTSSGVQENDENQAAQVDGGKRVTKFVSIKPAPAVQPVSSVGTLGVSTSTTSVTSGVRLTSGIQCATTNVTPSSSSGESVFFCHHCNSYFASYQDTLRHAHEVQKQRSHTPDGRNATEQGVRFTPISATVQVSSSSAQNTLTKIYGDIKRSNAALSSEPISQSSRIDGDLGSKKKKKEKGKSCHDCTCSMPNTVCKKHKRIVISSSSCVTIQEMPKSASTSVANQKVPKPVSSSVTSQQMSKPVSISVASTTVLKPVSTHAANQQTAKSVSSSVASQQMSKPVSISKGSTTVPKPVPTHVTSQQMAKHVSISVASQQMSKPVSIRKVSTSVPKPVSTSVASQQKLNPESTSVTSQQMLQPKPKSTMIVTSQQIPKPASTSIASQQNLNPESTSVASQQMPQSTPRSTGTMSVASQQMSKPASTTVPSPEMSKPRSTTIVSIQKMPKLGFTSFASPQMPKPGFTNVDSEQVTVSKPGSGSIVRQQVVKPGSSIDGHKQVLKQTTSNIGKGQKILRIGSTTVTSQQLQRGGSPSVATQQVSKSEPNNIASHQIPNAGAIASRLFPRHGSTNVSSPQSPRPGTVNVTRQQAPKPSVSTQQSLPEPRSASVASQQVPKFGSTFVGSQQMQMFGPTQVTTQQMQNTGHYSAANSQQMPSMPGCSFVPFPQVPRVGPVSSINQQIPNSISSIGSLQPHSAGIVASSLLSNSGFSHVYGQQVPKSAMNNFITTSSKLGSGRNVVVKPYTIPSSNDQQAKTYHVDVYKLVNGNVTIKIQLTQSRIFIDDIGCNRWKADKFLERKSSNTDNVNNDIMFLVRNGNKFSLKPFKDINLDFEREKDETHEETKMIHGKANMRQDKKRFQPKCFHCEKRFISNRHKRDHILDKHDYCCRYCPMRCNDTDELIQHERGDHAKVIRPIKSTETL